MIDVKELISMFPFQAIHNMFSTIAPQPIDVKELISMFPFQAILFAKLQHFIDSLKKIFYNNDYQHPRVFTHWCRRQNESELSKTSSKKSGASTQLWQRQRGSLEFSFSAGTWLPVTLTLWLKSAPTKTALSILHRHNPSFSLTYSALQQTITFLHLHRKQTCAIFRFSKIYPHHLLP